MAVTGLKEIPPGRSSGADAKGYRHKRVFWVRCDSMADGPFVAQQAVYGGESIPQIHDPHPDNAAAWVVRLNATPIDDDPLNFHVEVQYDSVARGYDEDVPWLRPATFSANFSIQNEEVVRDFFGELIQNSAGDLFQGVTYEVTYPMLFVTQNAQAGTGGRWSFATVAQLNDTVNDDVWFGLQANQGKLNIMGVVYHQEGNYRYWEITYRFAIKWSGWNPSILDAGMREYLPDPPRMVAITDDQGVPPSQPVPLNGAGRALAAGLFDTTANPPVYLPLTPAGEAQRTFTLYRKISFAQLQIRWPWA